MPSSGSGWRLRLALRGVIVQQTRHRTPAEAPWVLRQVVECGDEVRGIAAF
jgi:hypothetical protein